MEVRTILRWLAAGSLAAVLGCGLTHPPQWQSASYRDMNRSDLMQMVATVLATDYNVTRQDPLTGEIETGWQYGHFNRVTHQQMRQRALARVVRSDQHSLLVTVRVEQEINEERGVLLNLAAAKWTGYEDDVLQSQLILRRLESLLYGTQPEEAESGSSQESAPNR